jgi:hypothetical protein
MIGWTNTSQQNIDQGFAFFSSIQDIFPDADMRFVFLLFFLSHYSLTSMQVIFETFFVSRETRS